MGDAVIGVSYSTKREPQVLPQNAAVISDTTDTSSDQEQPGGEKEKQVSLSHVFRYADGLDWLFMVLGTLGAAGHATIFMTVNIIFGEQIDTFVDFQIGHNYLAQFQEEFDKFGVTKRDVWANKSLLDIIGGATNNSMMNSSRLPADMDDEIFLQMMWDTGMIYIGMSGLVLLLAFLQISMWSIAAARQSRRMRTLFLRTVLRQEVGWYDEVGSGQLNTRLTSDMQKIADGMGDKVGSLLQFVLGFVVAIVLSLVKGWKLTLVMCTILPVVIGTGMASAILMANLTRKELKAYAKAGHVAEEVLGAIRTVAAFGGEQKESERYNTNLLEAQTRGIKKGLIYGGSQAITWTAIYATYGLSFWFGGKLILEEESYTPGILMLVFFSMIMAAQYLGQAGPKIQATSNARGACTTVYSILDREPKIDAFSEEGLKPKHLEGNITFTDVYFQYPTRADVKVLQGLCLEVQTGQTVALVGTSGCGKSTTVQLLQRFYDVAKGTISVDGHDIKALNLRWLRQHIGVVSQEPVLFGTTIGENIRYGQDGATQRDIEQAAREANAHHFIEKLPQKYDTLVGERGAQLSGGQKQRIAIARALIRNPRILLLDEATSALDTESEALVQAALERASEGRTTIVIAHRLSTIRNADLICAFDQGVIVEQGNHKELMDKRGVYYQLVTLQTKEGEMNTKAAETIKKQMSLTEDEGPRSRANSVRSLSSQGSLRPQSLAPTRAAHRMISFDKETPNSESIREEKSVPLKRIVRMNAAEWPYIVLGCVAAFLNGSEGPLYAIFLTNFLNTFATEDVDINRANLFAGLFSALGVFLGICHLVKNCMFAQSGERLTMRMRKMAFRAMLRQDISYFDSAENNLGALTTRLATDAASVQGATGSRLGMILQNICTMTVSLTIALVNGWKVALVTCSFIPLMALAALVEVKLLAGSAINDKDNMESAGKVAVEAIENIRTVAGLTREEAFVEMYAEKLKTPSRNAIKKAIFVGISFAISQASIYVCFAVGFYYGAHQILDDEMDFENVFMILTVVFMGAMGLGETIAYAPDYTKATVAAGRVFSLLDQVPQIDVASDKGNTLETFSGHVKFQHVHFRYPTRPEVPVLQGLDLEVTPGKTLALVGASGCGKSTTVSLIERFYDSLLGSVCLDGQPIQELRLPWVRQQIGLVSQEPVLFHGTLADNIAYGDNTRQVDMQDIIQAAKSANIHSFIQSLPQGYETPVGEKGAQLSGGQKQRVAIARALVRSPRILLLDEATSALDTESEKVVQEALDKARSGRTCITVAHRLATIQDADQIAVFHNGVIVEKGTHSQLLAFGGIYSNLYHAQSSGKGPKS